MLGAVKTTSQQELLSGFRSRSRLNEREEREKTVVVIDFKTGLK